MLTAKELAANLGTNRAKTPDSKPAGDALLGGRLERERKEYGLTQEDVSTATGIGRSHLAMYETGMAMPTVRRLAVLAKFFDVSFDYLIGHMREEPSDS